MSALFLLFERKFTSTIQDFYNIVGYEPDRKELSEHLYALYLVVILVGWVLAMLGWAAFTVSGFLGNLKLPPATVSTLLFYGLALWLILIPLLASGGYDLHRFSLGDLYFLSNAPYSPALVALFWFAKSLWKPAIGLFGLVCGILASSFSYLAGINDWLGFALGLVSGLAFTLTVMALRWVLALRRYRPKPGFQPVVGYSLTVIGFGLLVLFPWSQVLFWPASLASYLIVGRTAHELILGGTGVALALLLLTVVALIGLLYWTARSTLLAPAFEEGRLGGQLRLATGSGGDGGEARLQYYLTRKFSTRHSQIQPASLKKALLIGVAGTLFYRQLVRLKRLPPYQLIGTSLIMLFGGASVAAGFVRLSQPGSPLALMIQLSFFANYGLLRLGTTILRRELGYIALWVDWPVSRFRFMLNALLLNFGLPFLSGETGLLLSGAGGMDWEVVFPWLLLWPLLLALDVVVVLIIFQFRLKKWPATPETVPKVGAGVVAITGLLWLLAVAFGPVVGLSLVFVMLSGSISFLRSRLT